MALTLIESTEHKPWERLPDEPLFWYSRYKRFQGLGPKRTMLAALEQERRVSKVPKSTENGKKPKSVAVPGSWKQASSKWRWVERAQAYDDDKVEKMVALMFEDLYNGPALAFNRIMTLRNIFDTITKDFNAHHTYLSPDQRIAYHARMTAILRDIREEMKAFDAPAQLLLVRYFAQKDYADYKSPTSREGFAQLVEKAGGQAALSEQIEAEIARRKEQKELEQLISSAFAEE
jgi:hypothetical protein